MEYEMTSWKQIYKKLKFYWRNLMIDSHSIRFVRHSRQAWKDHKIKNPQGEVLMYYCDIPLIVLADSYFTNLLAKKHNAEIRAFSATRKPFPWSLFYWKRDWVYRSFNTKEFVRTALNSDQKKRKAVMVEGILKQVKTKQELFDLTIDGVWLGVDIYETYLRVCSKPTADLNDPGLVKIIDKAVEILIFGQDYLQNHNVKAIVVSHDAYIYENIVCKLCYLKNIPVYLPNIIGGCYATRPYAVCDPLFKNYPAMFKRLSPKDQEEGIAIAKSRMQRRLSGEVGVDMPYSTKSAFSKKSAERVLRKSDKIKILICSHCFYDNPQAYGKILFPDFYEWLCFLGQMSEKTDYDWYIKMHPDPLPGTEEIIRGILAKYPKITFIPPQTSQLQLIEEGVNFIFTVYGSVGHELAALGVQVVNAGYNPHYGYDFNWHPKTVEEYEHMILNLAQLKKTINPRDVYEFYYMHYFYVIADSLFLKSYRTYISETLQSKDADYSGYSYFLKDLDEAKHQQICANLQNFMDSGKTYYFSRGPEGEISSPSQETKTSEAVV